MEERVLRRIGSPKNIPVDLLLVAATNQDLQRLIGEGKFRKDLYYRLNIVHLELPPLRERGEDVILMARHFIEEFNRAFRRNLKGLDPEVEEIFRGYQWKGNVRELKNFLERIVLLEDCEIVRREHLPPELYPRQTAAGAATRGGPSSMVALNAGFSLERTLAGFQREIIIKALRQSRGNKTDAAKLLGLKRLALHHLIRKLDLRV